MTAPVTAQMQTLFGRWLGAVNLNVGLDSLVWEPGFVNVDRPGRPDVDLTCDSQTLSLALANGSVDCILARRVLERMTDLKAAIAEFHRLLKPGGYLIAVTPYASSDDAWEDPANVRAFTERSWSYFPGYRLAALTLVPFADLAPSSLAVVGDGAEFAVKKRFLRNVVREMHAVLEKVAP